MNEAKTATAAVREFNRFYTKILGLLDPRFLGSPYSLTEARVLYELAHDANCTAKAIRAAIGVDAGYLSRILDSFIGAGLIEKMPSPHDGRSRVLRLTRAGEAAFARLDEAQEGSVEVLISKLARREREELVRHMRRIRELLDEVGHMKGG